MPSTTRGSILISTANDIGEALVEKLGGVGYSPNEWKEKYNLCGIAPIDSAPALSVLSDSAVTGDERGSILIATADAIGAILNKKYNVLRGFKPKEWASACRKMKALESGSVASSSIASFSDGADGVPLTSCVCNIDANLDGKNAVNAVHAGVNLFNKNAISPNTWIVVNSTETEATNSYLTSDYIPVKANTRYFVSFKDSNRSAYYDKNKNGIAYFSFNGNASFSALYDGYIRITIKNDVDLDTFIVNEGNEQATFEAYKGKTKTADLGRAVYGGSADIIKGEGQELCGKIVFDGSETRWSAYTAGNGYAIPLTGMKRGTWYTSPLALSDPFPKVPNNDNLGVRIGVNNDGIYVVQANTIEGVTDLTSFKAWLAENPLTIIYPLDIEIDFTFEPVKIDSLAGTNNIWNDCGNTAVEYYQAPTPYARKTATGGIANFSDQRTDLPLTKAIANIAPSIAGKSAVNLVRAGRNLLLPHIEDISETTLNGIKRSYSLEDQEFTFTGTNTKTDAAWLIYSLNAGDFVLNGLKPGATYCFSHNLTADMYAQVTYNKTGGGIGAMGYLRGNAGQNASVSFTLPSDFDSLRGFQIGVVNTATSVNVTAHFQIEVGSSASAFEQYQAPTTYTAELGETVYGGSVDFVSGEVVKEQDKTTLTNDGWTYYATAGKNTFNKIISGAEAGELGLLDGYTFEQVSYISQQSDKCFYFYASGGNVRISIRDDAYTSAEEFAEHINGASLVYTLATPTESAIPGRVISPIDGVNNYWNDAGGDTEIQYFEDET